VLFRTVNWEGKPMAARVAVSRKIELPVTSLMEMLTLQVPLATNIGNSTVPS
jgi:hypothetical protein